MSPPVKRAKNKKRTAAPDSTSVNGTSATPSIPAKATGEDSIAGAMGNKDSEDDENSSEEWGNAMDNRHKGANNTPTQQQPKTTINATIYHNDRIHQNRFDDGKSEQEAQQGSSTTPTKNMKDKTINWGW
eukprot:CAMPEP_0183731142 /NCGR_PEP_ID=MMETSP0737-20130205/34584_1 /TAXON_ID=385413 /ORGANISM="Thalassiosira miniscula, Strain CCMP1093" /LENGTH=129 /DNA_ID=CAMNT_0025963805 /DNA_START=123 /DNA_END=510 /DNA_ORIENTATION=-